MSKAQLDLYAHTDLLTSAILERMDDLQQQGVQVQSQPLGFMRLPLDGQLNAAEGLFMHVWMENLPTQKGGPFLHTHVFHLTSRILRGRIRDVLYEPRHSDTPTHVLVSGKCAQDHCIPEKRLSSVCMEVVESRDVTEGNVYEIPEGVFHETVRLSPVAITIMQKSGVKNADPVLAIPMGVSVHHESFSRNQIDQEWAWKTIRTLLHT